MTKENLRFLVIRTLDLDRKTLFRARWIPLQERFELVLKKYLALAKHGFRPFRLGKSRVSLGNSTLYYDSGLGSLAGFQAVLTEHGAWFRELASTANPLVLDVGANVGYVSRLIMKLIPDARVVAFEPSPVSSDVAVKNCPNARIVSHKHPLPFPGQVHVLNIALNSTGQPMFLEEELDSSALSRTVKDSQGGGIEVAGSTLDQVAKSWIETEEIWLLKVDVEGNELDVLRGATRVLPKVRHLHIELNPAHWSIGDLFALLDDCELTAELIAIRNFSYPTDGSIREGDALFRLENRHRRSPQAGIDRVDA